MDLSKPLGKIRALGELDSIPVSKSLLKKVGSKISIKKKTVKKVKAKKQAALKKSSGTQKKLSDFFKPKPKPGSK